MNGEYFDRWSLRLDVAIKDARQSRALPGSRALARPRFLRLMPCEAHEIADGWVSSTLEGKAWLARANCPELAIEIECAGERASPGVHLLPIGQAISIISIPPLSKTHIRYGTSCGKHVR